MSYHQNRFLKVTNKKFRAGFQVVLWDNDVIVICLLKNVNSYTSLNSICIVSLVSTIELINSIPMHLCGPVDLSNFQEDSIRLHILYM